MSSVPHAEITRRLTSRRSRSRHAVRHPTSVAADMGGVTAAALEAAPTTGRSRRRDRTAAPAVAHTPAPAAQPGREGVQQSCRQAVVVTTNRNPAT